MLDRNVIYRQATDLGALLAQTDEVAAYREAEEALLQHKTATGILQRLRELQQTAEETDDEASVAPMYEEIDQLLGELETIPEAVSFEQAQEVVNALLQTVSQIIADGVISQS